MGSSDNKLHVLEARCSKDRSSIARLRDLLPPGIFALVVKRISKGDALTSVSRYLNSIQRNIAGETFRKWLQPLAIEVRELLAQETPLDDLAKVIEDSNTGPALPAVGRPPGPSAGSAKRLKSVVKRACEDIRAEMMLRYTWVLQQDRVDRMVDFEKRMGVLLPEGYKEVDTLRKIAASLMKFELGKTVMNSNVPKTSQMEPPEPGSAEKVPRSNDIDPAVSQKAAREVIDMVTENAGWSQTKTHLQPSGEKLKAAIPESGGHDLRAEPPPPEKLPEKPTSRGTQREEEHDPPKKIPDLFLIG